MIFTPANIDGAFVIEPEKLEDERGFFARSFCQREFQQHGIDPRVAQCNICFNPQRGTLRGLHSNQAPYEEAKLIRCTRGAIFDVLLDLREASPSYRNWLGVELSADNYKMLFSPAGVYHGYLTLESNSEIAYHMSVFYEPGKLLGVRWDDPTFSIVWPHAPQHMSERDATFPDYDLSARKA